MCALFGINIFTPSPQELQSGTDNTFLIYEPEQHDKIILSVADNGVGVKTKDKDKLFKLFGCLQTTRQMNT